MANKAVTWTAQSAAVTSTRNESKQCGWLQRVSIHATTQDGDKMTYQGRPSHPPILHSPFMESLDRTVDTEDPRLNLQTSVTRKKPKLQNLDVLTQCGRYGGLETESDSRTTFLQSARAGECNEVLENLQMSVAATQYLRVYLAGRQVPQMRWILYKMRTCIYSCAIYLSDLLSVYQQYTYFVITR